MQSLTRFGISTTEIVLLEPLRGMKTISSLRLNDNHIRDISPLAELENLETLNLSGNYITDITFLSNLHKLKSLQVYDNCLSSDINVQSILDANPALQYVGGIEPEWQEPEKCQ